VLRPIKSAAFITQLLISNWTFSGTVRECEMRIRDTDPPTVKRSIAPQALVCYMSTVSRRLPTQLAVIYRDQLGVRPLPTTQSSTLETFEYQQVRVTFTKPTFTDFLPAAPSAVARPLRCPWCTFWVASCCVWQSLYRCAVPGRLLPRLTRFSSDDFWAFLL